MIKRILVALDVDTDTPVATRYALRLAKRYNATLTGLAIVDVKNIYTSIGYAGGAGMYYADRMREYLTEDTRREAQRLIRTFSDLAEKSGAAHVETIEEGVPYEYIIDEMKYHDLLVIGRESHFFYNRPDQTTNTVSEVVKRGVSPTIVVLDEYHDVDKMLIAFDGSEAAARTLQHFVHLQPFGKDIEIDLVHVPAGDAKDDVDESNWMLSRAEHYLRDHGFAYVNRATLDHGDPSRRIFERLEKSPSDMVLLGAHSVSAIKRLTLGSTTHEVITKSKVPLFLGH
jgi:nucleotide-binding universal stress UspA family protein